MGSIAESIQTEELLIKRRRQLKAELVGSEGRISRAAIVSLIVILIYAPLSNAHQHELRIYTVPPKRAKAKPSKPPAVPKRQDANGRGAKKQAAKPRAVKQQAAQEQALREQAVREQASEGKSVNGEAVRKPSIKAPPAVPPNAAAPKP